MKRKLEFAIPKTNDYNILKEFLKNEFFKSMNEYYPNTDSTHDSEGFFSKLSVKEPDEIIPNETTLRDLEKDEFEKSMTDPEAIPNNSSKTDFSR